MTEPEIPEQVYLDAARLNVAEYYAEVSLDDPPRAEANAQRIAQRADFRAAVESAYRAGYQAGQDRPRWGLGPDRIEVTYTEVVPALTDEMRAAVLESAAKAYHESANGTVTP